MSPGLNCKPEILFPSPNFRPTFLRALGITELLDLAFLSGLVLRISFTVAGEGAIMAEDENNWDVQEYNPPGVGISVERLISGAGELTTSIWSSGSSAVAKCLVPFTGR